MQIAHFLFGLWYNNVWKDKLYNESDRPLIIMIIIFPVKHAKIWVNWLFLVMVTAVTHERKWSCKWQQLIKWVVATGVPHSHITGEIRFCLRGLWCTVSRGHRRRMAGGLQILGSLADEWRQYGCKTQEMFLFQSLLDFFFVFFSHTYLQSLTWYLIDLGMGQWKRFPD